MLRKKGSINRLPAAPHPTEQSNPMSAYKRAFCEWTQTAGLSSQTAKHRDLMLGYFIRWADERGVRHPGEVTRPVLQRYQRYLYLSRTAQGKPLAHSSQLSRLNPLVAFFKWATREGHILANPAADLQPP